MAYTPKIIDKWLHVAQDGYPAVTRFHSRNWAGVQAFVLHVQEGYNWGSWQHFHKVKASSTVMIARNGDIWRLVPEDKAPWTNGDVKNPDAQVRALMNKYGPDPNTWSLTIEFEGFTGNLPYTEEQYQSGLWQLREWKRKYGDKPLLRHGQINAVDRYFCPERPGGPLMTRLMRDLGKATPDAAFKAGDTVKFTANLNIRRAWTTAATYDGKPNVLATLPAGTVATIIAGPNHKDGYAWYDVSIDGFGTGHVAGDWLEKTTAPKPTPVPAAKTFTTRFELLLRTTPGFWDYTADKSNVIKSIPAGTTGIVKSGPKDADGVSWYEVDIKGIGEGWIQTEVLNTVQIHDAD